MTLPGRERRQCRVVAFPWHGHSCPCVVGPAATLAMDGGPHGNDRAGPRALQHGNDERPTGGDARRTGLASRQGTGPNGNG